MRVGISVLLLGLALVALPAGGATASPRGAATTATAVAVGMDHTCALTSAGAVKCWGDNYHGTLGDGTTIERHDPVDVSGLGSGVRAIAAGDYYSCAITHAGGVKCWGLNDFGQLGDGTTRERHAPVGVSGLGSGVVAIAAGSVHACALTTPGAVKCWGYNGFGQLGNGRTRDSRTPVDVTGLTDGAVAIAAGLDYSCAVTSSGVAKCWGNNSYGKLGDGTMIDRSTPVGVAGLTSGVTAVTASDAQGHTCALTTAGAVECWGGNGFGELGTGTTVERHTPVGVSALATGTAAVAAGGFYTCALWSGGTVRCWGDNSDGALGDGTTIDRSTPVAVAGLGGATSIAAGLSHTCAVTSSGGLECWGENALGELGDGTTNDHLRPVRVDLAVHCVVPSVEGRLLAAAEATIAKARCRVGTVARRLSSAKRKGRVLAQSPKPGRRLASGARIDLTVGKGPR